MKRPLLLSVVAWLMILFNAISIAMIAYYSAQLVGNSEPALVEVFNLPPWVQVVTGTLFGVSKIAAGIGILRALRWARPLYVAAFIVEIAVAVVDYPPSLYQLLIPSFLISCAVLYLLFRKSSSQYFSLGVSGDICNR